MAVKSEKHKRYDRQLRLWGDHGQAALEGARVCLLNATATGTEILKNLILPGIGGFTIVDSAKVSGPDLGSNFFVSPKCLGQSRAESAVRMLQKLNDVKGDFIEDDIEAVLSSNPLFFTQFTMVVATSLPEATLSKIAAVLWTSSIPLLVSRTYGMVGFIRLAVPSHEVIESHPDNYHEDLRLDCPFSGLVDFMNSICLDDLDNTQHSNIPYLVLLYKFLKIWKKSHNGLIPQTYSEKKIFKSLIQDGVRCNEVGVPLEEENFVEAIQNVNRAVITYTIPPYVHDVLESPLCTTLPEPSKFWLLVRALREFVLNEGCGRLPLQGSIPDMTSNSAIYIDLCKVYQYQAKKDMEFFQTHLNQVLFSIGKSPSYISEEEVRLFCRCSAFLCFLNYRSIAQEFDMPDGVSLRYHFNNEDSNIVCYVLLRAAEQFYRMYHFYPGDGLDGIEADTVKLKSIIAYLIQQWQIPSCNIHDDHITEFCRYGAGEIHSVAAFVGGVAAQESIKIITHQFVPLNNTWIYNATNSSTLTFAI